MGRNKPWTILFLKLLGGGGCTSSLFHLYVAGPYYSLGHWAIHEFDTGKMYIWDKVFKNEPSKIWGRQPLKYLKGYGLLKTGEGCLPQILVSPFLNTFSHIKVT